MCTLSTWWRELFRLLSVTHDVINICHSSARQRSRKWNCSTDAVLTQYLVLSAAVGRDGEAPELFEQSGCGRIWASKCGFFPGWDSECWICISRLHIPRYPPPSSLPPPMGLTAEVLFLLSNISFNLLEDLSSSCPERLQHVETLNCNYEINVSWS